MPDQTLETTGAICADCGQNMLHAKGCKLEFIPVPRILYGDETLWDDVPPQCHDCGASVGYFHHLRCDMEECPKCHGQLISCGC